MYGTVANFVSRIVAAAKNACGNIAGRVVVGARRLRRWFTADHRVSAVAAARQQTGEFARSAVSLPEVLIEPVTLSWAAATGFIAGIVFAIPEISIATLMVTAFWLTAAGAITAATVAVGGVAYVVVSAVGALQSALSGKSKPSKSYDFDAASDVVAACPAFAVV